MSIDIRLPFGPFRQAISTVFGAILAFLIVSMLGAAVVTFAAEGDISLSDFLFTVFLAWVGQWAASGVMLWGWVFLAIHVFLLYDYVHGDRDPLVNLTLLFANQIIVSTTVLILFSRGENLLRPLVAGFVCLALAAAFLWKLRRDAQA